MQTFKALLFLFAVLLLSTKTSALQSQKATAPKQLLAVRGEVVKIERLGKERLLITIRPARDFAEVTVLARENDLVGNAPASASGTDLFGLLTDEARDEETITAAEVNNGDLLSVIYDPELQNRVIEIYLH